MQNVARQQAAASGLGRGGGLNTRERLIQEDLNRRGIASMRDIRAGALAEGRAGVTRANELATQMFLNQGFTLPESGRGTSSIGRFPNFNFATSPAPTTQQSLTRLPTQSQQSFTARRF
jgi:hypothetical protein